MALDSEFDSIEWQALNGWLDRRQSGMINAGPSGSGTGRANLIARESENKTRKQADKRRNPDVTQGDIEDLQAEIKKKPLLEREPGITEAVGRTAQRLGQAARGTLLGVGGALLGPPGILLGGFNITAVIALVTAAVLVRVQAVNQRLEAQRAIKPDAFFRDFGTEEILSATGDEIIARAQASYQFWTDVVNGGGFSNSMGRYTENIQRNRSVLPHHRVMTDTRDMRRRDIFELSHDNYLQGGIKKQGLNGG